jgi:uncharacterized protein YbjT (DUF2867 family)
LKLFVIGATGGTGREVVQQALKRGHHVTAFDDAVVSALGSRQVFKPSSLLQESALAAIRAMQRSGVRRLVVLSAAAHFPGIPNRIVSFILRNHMRDSLAMEKVVQDSSLDWTIARPPRLTQNNTQRIEAGKMLLPDEVSLFPAKRWQRSCSIPSSKRNIFRKSWALRNSH